MSAGDAFAELVMAAASAGVREALNVSEATNRRLLTVGEAATYLALSEREIYAKIARGDLPPVRSGRATRLDIQDLDNWIVRNKG